MTFLAIRDVPSTQVFNLTYCIAYVRAPLTVGAGEESPGGGDKVYRVIALHQVASVFNGLGGAVGHHLTHLYQGFFGKYVAATTAYY